MTSTLSPSPAVAAPSRTRALARLTAPRAAALAAAAGALVLAAAMPASASPAASAQVAGTPSGTQTAAAARAAHTAPVLAAVGRFFAHPAPGAAAAAHPAAQAAGPARVVGATVPVYYLDPAFVTAHSTATPVARLAFMATEAIAPDGRHASVWTAPDPAHAGSWVQVNIASGSDETDYAAAAARYAPGAVAFEEPQVHAWYAVSGGHVQPLNSDAVRSVGASGTTLAGYQRLVAHRYGDKQAGSAYAKAHMLGGFDPASTVAGHSSGDRTRDAGWAGAAAAVAALSAFGFTRVRRARRARTD